MKYERVSDDPCVQRYYEACRAQGTSHTLAEMFALGRAPMGNTDAVFLQGTGNGSQFEGQEHIGDFYKREATKAGVSVTGKVYKSGLARYPGDPEAWVGGRGDVQRLVESRGWSCEGSVNVKGRQCEPTVVAGLAEDLVQERVEAIASSVEGSAFVDREDLAEQVRAKHGPQKKLGGA